MVIEDFDFKKCLSSEVTPKSFRLRKKILNAEDRKKAARNN